MAENLDNVVGNQLEVFFADEAAPFNTTVTLADPNDVVPVYSQRYGTTPIAHLVQGHKPEITLEIEEWEKDIVARSFGMATSGADAYKPPKVGSKPPTIAVRLHNPHDEDTSGDIVFGACIFKGFGRTIDGNGPAKHTVTLAAQKPATGEVYEIGYTAP